MRYDLEALLSHPNSSDINDANESRAMKLFAMRRIRFSLPAKMSSSKICRPCLRALHKAVRAELKVGLDCNISSYWTFNSFGNSVHLYHSRALYRVRDISLSIAGFCRTPSMLVTPKRRSSLPSSTQQRPQTLLPMHHQLLLPREQMTAQLRFYLLRRCRKT